MSKSLNSDQSRHVVGSGLDPNYLHRLSVKDTSILTSRKTPHLKRNVNIFQTDQTEVMNFSAL